jgi:hypothetical protein
MLSRLWGWIAAIGAAMLTALVHYRGQRDAAEQEAEAQKAKAQEIETTRGVEQDAQRAKADARKAAVDTQKKADKRPDGKRPTGSFRR